MHTPAIDTSRLSPPAICDRCGKVFPALGLRMGPKAKDAHLEGVQVDCPNCGGVGRVPDGVYDFSEKVVRILATTDRSRADLQRMRELLRRAAENGDAPEVVKAAIKKDVPALSKLADLLPSNKDQFLLYLTVVIGLASLAHDMYGTKEAGTTINQTINQQITIQAPAEPKAPAMKEKRRMKKGERNARRRGTD